MAITASRGSPAHSIIGDVLDHEQTRVETGIERAILAELGGGCIAPIGVHASATDSGITVQAQVFDITTEEPPIEEHSEFSKESVLEATHDFICTLNDRGATELIERARTVPENTA